MKEARLEQRPEGLTAATDGWFVVNVADAAWVHNDFFGAACIFEGEDAPFSEIGYTIGVIQPGRPSGIETSSHHQNDGQGRQGGVHQKVGDLGDLPPFWQSRPPRHPTRGGLS